MRPRHHASWGRRLRPARWPRNGCIGDGERGALLAESASVARCAAAAAAAAPGHTLGTRCRTDDPGLAGNGASRVLAALPHRVLARRSVGR